ncbi:MAG TPA: hypothetical protein VGZ90_11655 [Puia sp.]|jgi:hypothetical protein|nr:hypothetical protein [Puia sp.]
MKLNSRKTVFSKFRLIGENFSTLKVKSIRIYMIGQLVSLLGDWMQQTGQENLSLIL